MCGQVYSEHRKENISLDFELLKSRIIEFPSIKSAYLFGGEPLIYKNAEPLMQFLTENHIEIDMSTNGVLLDKYIDRIFNYNINSISISIDTLSREKYKQVRGVDCFDIVLQNIKNLADKKRSLNLPVRPYINVNYVVLKNNIDELEDFYNYFYREVPELCHISIEPQIVMSKSLGKDYEALMKEQFQCNGGSWRWFNDKLDSFSDDDLKKLCEIFNRLRGKDKAFFLGPKDVESLHFSYSEEYKCSDTVCLRPFTVLSILPNGDVTFCVDFPDCILGNIYESSISDIWNSERAKKFQEYVLYHDLPICARCPHSF
jgi:radical SAM protein with 4Fe4S-binding SPASM domain